MSDFFDEDFLNALPEEDKEIFNKYLPDVTSRVDTIKSDYETQLNNYAELGDVDDLKMAKQAYQALIEQPDKVYEILKQQIEAEQLEQEKKEAPLKELPPEFAAQFKELQDKISPALSFFEQQQINQQQQANIAAVDAMLADLNKKYGEFDKEYVLGQMVAGKSPDDAVTAYRAFENRVTANTNKAKLPPSQLSGTGTMTQEKRPANAAERKALLTQMLTQANLDR